MDSMNYNAAGHSLLVNFFFLFCVRVSYSTREVLCRLSTGVYGDHFLGTNNMTVHLEQDRLATYIRYVIVCHSSCEEKLGGTRSTVDYCMYCKTVGLGYRTVGSCSDLWMSTY
jgi:hypothetical protein